MMYLYNVLQEPYLTEKSTQLEKNKKITLKVGLNATKMQIKKAIEKFFNIKVLNVNTIIMRGKNKRVGKYRGKASNWKKAIILLAKSEDTKLFGFSY